MANTVQKNLSLTPETLAQLKSLADSVGMFESFFVDDLIKIFGEPYAIEKKRAQDYLAKNVQANILENSNLFNYSTASVSSAKALPPPTLRVAKALAKKISALRETGNTPLISLPVKRRGNGRHTNPQNH